METFFPLIGPWFWWIVAAVLLIGELFAPGVFLIWLAAAAALTGLADLAFDLNWHMEVAVFAVLSVVLVLLSWRWVMANRKPVTDQPHLNERLEAYVGRRASLSHPIVNGVGKVSIDDALWAVEGPDLPVGTQVKVTGVSGHNLTVVKFN